MDHLHLHSLSFTMLRFCTPYLCVINNHVSQHKPALGTHNNKAPFILWWKHLPMRQWVGGGELTTTFHKWHGSIFVYEKGILCCPFVVQPILGTCTPFVWARQSTTSSLKASMPTRKIFWGVFPVVALWYPQLYWKVELELWNEIKILILCAIIETDR